jgi:hypothetical protein
MERRRTEHAASITPAVAGVIATLPLRCCVGEVSGPPAQSRTPPRTTIRAAWSAPAISPRSVSSSPDSSRLARVLWGLSRYDRLPGWLRADCSSRASLRDEWLGFLRAILHACRSRASLSSSRAASRAMCALPYWTEAQRETIRTVIGRVEKRHARGVVAVSASHCCCSGVAERWGKA